MFLPVEDLPGKKLWLAYATNVAGGVTLNAGAKKAVCEKGSSFCPPHYRRGGRVEAGDAVSILDDPARSLRAGWPIIGQGTAQNRGVPLGRDSEKIGYKNYDEAVHRDNIVLL